MNITDQQRRLFELRALIYAKISALVWRLVDMHASGEHENDECRMLMRDALFISSRTPEIHRRLFKLRQSGSNFSPEYAGLKRILEVWKERLHDVNMRLKAEGVV